MASSSGYPPWAKKNPEQQGLVRHSRKYFQLIRKKTADLCEIVRFVDLRVFLISLGVIDTVTEHRLKSHSIGEDQVAALLEYLLVSQCWKFHAFVKALCMAGQDGVVSQILCLNPDEYKGDYVDHEQKYHKKQLKKEIKSHRDVYHRTLMKGKLFDIPSCKIPYDMERCIIEVVATSDELLQNPEKILPANILKPKPGKPRLRTALLSGPPGAGKSTFIKCFVYKWCQRDDGESDWDLIVILNVSTLVLTPGRSPQEHIKEAVRQSLEGPGDKEAIMKSLDDDSLKILIIPDGMDESRNPTIMSMLKELISSCYKGELGFTVLSTCRSGLSQIEESLFDRCMKTDGFTRDEGIKYVQKYYTEIQKPDDDLMYGYIANSEGELDHILTIPLCTHILSVVTGDGTLKLQKGQRLRLKTLFQAMEKSMKKRQLEKNSTQGAKMLNEKELEDQTNWFYLMSLYALLTDHRTISKDLLDKFKISDQNPYLTFMTQKKAQRFDDSVYEQLEITINDPLFMSVYLQAKEDSRWAYNHEMFYEYFSASALETLPSNLRAALLVTISSQEKFRNTQRLLFSVLGGDTDHLGTLSDIIRGNMIMQSKFQKLDANVKDFINDIKLSAATSVDLNDLLNNLIPQNVMEVGVDTSKSEVLWLKIKDLYENQAEVLQRSGVIHDLQDDHNHGLLHHIYNCLQELPEEHQQQVFGQSLGCAMPSIRLDYDGNRHILYSTGGMRWTEVNESNSEVTVNICHSLTDASQAVRQYGHQHLQAFLGGNLDCIQIEMARHPILINEIWRSPIDEEFLSTRLWSECLSHISDWPVTAGELLLYTFGPIYESCIQSFLQCLQMESTQEALRRILVQDEGGRLRIQVQDGLIDSESLLAWTHWYLQQDLLQVKLSNVTYKVSGTDPDSRQQEETRVHSLLPIHHNGCHLFYGLEIEESPQRDTRSCSFVTQPEHHNSATLKPLPWEHLKQNHQQHPGLPSSKLTAHHYAVHAGDRDGVLEETVGLGPPAKKHRRTEANPGQHQVQQQPFVTHKPQGRYSEHHRTTPAATLSAHSPQYQPPWLIPSLGVAPASTNLSQEHHTWHQIHQAGQYGRPPTSTMFAEQQLQNIQQSVPNYEGLGTPSVPGHHHPLHQFHQGIQHVEQTPSMPPPIPPLHGLLCRPPHQLTFQYPEPSSRAAPKPCPSTQRQQTAQHSHPSATTATSTPIMAAATSQTTAAMFSYQPWQLHNISPQYLPTTTVQHESHTASTSLLDDWKHSLKLFMPQSSTTVDRVGASHAPSHPLPMDRFVHASTEQNRPVDCSGSSRSAIPHHPRKLQTPCTPTETIAPCLQTVNLMGQGRQPVTAGHQNWTVTSQQRPQTVGPMTGLQDRHQQTLGASEQTVSHPQIPKNSEHLMNRPQVWRPQIPGSSGQTIAYQQSPQHVHWMPALQESRQQISGVSDHAISHYQSPQDATLMTESQETPQAQGLLPVSTRGQHGPGYPLGWGGVQSVPTNESLPQQTYSGSSDTRQPPSSQSTSLPGEETVGNVPMPLPYPTNEEYRRMWEHK